MIGLLGKAQFGSVELCQHTRTGDIYALKTSHKGLIVKNDMQESVMRERECWLKADHPFIVTLHALFNQTKTVYFLMDYLPGGSLADVYSRKRYTGSHSAAKFYIAVMVSALKHLHKKRVIHRDLRPENILLMESGYPKLVDFGLAKCVIGKTYTTCGSPDYMAPEILVGTGHTRAVDWWSVGVLTFELLVGHSPFSSSNPMDSYSKVMRGITNVPFPRELHGAAGDLIHGSLQREPVDRLAMRQGGVDNVQKHDWFAGFQWQELKEMNLVPPHKPVLKSCIDRSNYKVTKADMPKPEQYNEVGQKWDKDFVPNSRSRLDSIE
jgi:serine/threonine protein kinase